eukprot:5449388-Prymnesium_polylepis.1
MAAGIASARQCGEQCWHEPRTSRPRALLARAGALLLFADSGSRDPLWLWVWRRSWGGAAFEKEEGKRVAFLVRAVLACALKVHRWVA